MLEFGCLQRLIESLEPPGYYGIPAKDFCFGCIKS